MGHARVTVYDIYNQVEIRDTYHFGGSEKQPRHWEGLYVR
jgi:hypothetical protein